MWAWICVIIPVLLVEYAISQVRPLIEYEQSEPDKEVYKVFRRPDLTNLSRTRLYGVGIFLLIPRLILIPLFIFCDFLCCKILFLGYTFKPEQPISGLRYTLARLVHKIFCRLCLLCFGFYWIRETGQSDPSAALLISNHVSYLDILYYLSTDVPAFVSKASVKDYPLVGYIAQTLQCLFVDRTSGRGAALDQMKERQQNIMSNSSWPKLLVFPEGTTSNGSGLMPFKIGGFINSPPIQPSCVRYPYQNLNPSYEVVPIFAHMILLCCQLYNNLEVRRLPVIKAEGRTPQEYSDYCREVIAKELTLPKTHYSYEHSCELMSRVYKNKAKEY